MTLGRTSARRKGDAGFTLVELMIVVAIIGILAAIAVPNYQKFQSKSRQTEAKVALAAVFTAMKSFNSEYTSYSSCLSAMGYTPEGAGQFYAVGFSNAIAAGATCGVAGGVACNGNLGGNAPTCAAGVGTSHYLANRRANQTTALPVEGDLTSTVSTTAFTVEARGVVSNAAAAGTDRWTMTDQKVLTNAAAGI